MRSTQGKSWIRTFVAVAVMGVSAGLVGLGGIGGCTTNVATGRQQLAPMSRSEEIRLGTEAKPDLTKEFGGAVENAQLRGYVTEIGERLAEQTEGDNSTLPWEFTLLDSKVVNAFALPGGKVFISRGLAAELSNEAQLAAVIGHEIGHVTARHTNERFAQSAILTIGGAVVGGLIGAAADDDDKSIAVGAAAGATVGQVASLSFSRDQEIEADRLGMRYMSRLYYDPVAAIEVQEILKKASGGKSTGLAFFSTHPTSEQRISELRKRFDKYYRETVSNPQYKKYAEEYENRMLRVLKTLPPAKHAMVTPEQRERLMRKSSMRALCGLGDPAEWCGHCRAEGGVGGQ